jgi:putative membrane-bound dehydrogenase-like protein
MRARRSASLILILILFLSLLSPARSAEPKNRPVLAPGWRSELVARAPDIAFPTAIVVAPDGTVYLGQDPMDMPGPPTRPIDSVVAIKDGKVRVFADKLWAVMGLEWLDGALYVVHAPFLSSFRDTDGDGRADERIDLMTGLGPKLPGFNGINDHVASGVRLGIDGFLYISVGDKGIPKGVGKDGATIQLFGGGVIRIRPDGTGLEVVSTGERNPLSVALSATDEVFTYGNDDDSKKWPNSLTHHIVGGHHGYPYQFLNAPARALPIMGGQVVGSGTQAVCYNEDGLPGEYQGNLFVCDWGLQSVFRYTIEKKGGTFAIKSRTPFAVRGEQVWDFRPFSLAVAPDGASLYLVDWAFSGWLADGPRTGRLFKLTYDGPDKPTPSPRPTTTDPAARLQALDHPALSVRLESQRMLARRGDAEVGPLVARLREPSPETGRLHALWALDAIGTPEARSAIRNVLADPSAGVRMQAARSAGIRGDRGALTPLSSLLRDNDAAVRREAAIALGKLGDPSAAPTLMAALGDPDTFAAWSIRHALRALNTWDSEALTAALLDPRRREDALKLCDEVWATPVVDGLIRALPGTEPAETRAKVVATLAGLYRKYPPWSGAWFGTNPLAGQFPRKTEPWDPAAMARVQAGLSVAFKDASPAVRLQAIAGLLLVGRPALVTLRAGLATEKDPRNLAALAQGLGVLQDFVAAPALGAIVLNASQPEPVRVAALDALSSLRGPQALTARITLVYDPNAPAALVARALPALGREGIIPPNDLAGFLDHADPSIRASALLALTARKKTPDEVKQGVLARLDDASPEVRRAAVEAVVALNLREAVPKLLVSALKESSRSEATIALASMPDPRALPLFLAAIKDRSPDVRKAGESALLAIRETVKTRLEKAAQSGEFEGPAALALERVLTRFRPLTSWKVIGPFPRTTAQVFIGEASIDFGRTHTGAEGQSIAWTPRAGDPASGRVVLDDFKGGAGDRGGFGYDLNGSPDLCGFAFAEIQSDRDRDALLLVGSSGTVTVTVNEQPVYSFRDFAGRAYKPDSDLVRVALKAGKNRLLVASRQGIGVWSFSVQVSEPSTVAVAGRSKTVNPEVFRAFAMTRGGDPKGGESLFFAARGIGCVKCHSAAGKGTATIGPDLTGLALKYDKAEIIRSVLEPSNRLATGYQSVLLATRDGKVVTGLIRAETEAYIELVDSETKLTRVAKTEIEDRKVGDLSVMPAGQVDSLSVVEFADLISYLQSLKTAPAQPSATTTGR